MPPAFDDGVALFNHGRFFEAHEVFEELLDEVEEDERWDLLVALIQVAVGYHKWTSGHPGAARMLGLGLDKLSAFPDVAWGIDLGTLRGRVADHRDAAEGGRAPSTALPHIVVTGVGGM
jgi:predicted metal-dependent hydrolase